MPSSLLLAARNGGKKVSSVLLKKGAQVTMTDTVTIVVKCKSTLHEYLCNMQDGNSALHIAVEMSHREVVELLCFYHSLLDLQNKVS